MRNALPDYITRLTRFNMCNVCGGYGFYTEILPDGSKNGRICTHKTSTNFVLTQDKDDTSKLTRQHNKLYLRLVKPEAA